MTVISVLIPARNRTQDLLKTVHALVDRAQSPNQLQVLLGFDQDDTEGIDYYKNNIEPYLKRSTAQYAALLFHPQGNEQLNIYYNTLASKSAGDWIMLAHGLAQINSAGWDTTVCRSQTEMPVAVITGDDDQFVILSRGYYEAVGFVSVHSDSVREIKTIAADAQILSLIDLDVETRTCIAAQSKDFNSQEHIQHRQRCVKRILKMKEM